MISELAHGQNNTYKNHDDEYCAGACDWHSLAVRNDISLGDGADIEWFCLAWQHAWYRSEIPDLREYTSTVQGMKDVGPTAQL